MAWFRFYDEVLDDPKIQRLPSDIFKCWVNILCLAKRHGGILPDVTDVAFALRITGDEADELLNALATAGLLDSTKQGWEPHNWKGRQYASDNSMERVNRYRAKRRASGLPILADYSRFRPTLIERDGEKCIYCGTTKNLVVDHLVPIAHGGTDDTDNLGLACKQCNSGKAGRTPELAGMSILTPSAVTALQRYRDNNAVVTVTATPPEQNRTETETETEIEEERILSSKQQFDEWWPLVPRKKGKGAAFTKFKIALTKTDLATLKAGIMREAEESAGKEPQFICHPATWLHQERWLDEPERKTHGNRNRGNGKPSPHDTLLAAHARAAAPRPDPGEGKDNDPDTRGTGYAGGSATGIPRIRETGQ